MKFYSESKWLPGAGGTSRKTYMCTSCFYRRIVADTGLDDVEVIEGDQEFIIFPYSSLTKIDGTHAELCACPKCGTVQIIERADDEREVTHVYS